MRAERRARRIRASRTCARCSPTKQRAGLDHCWKVTISFAQQVKETKFALAGVPALCRASKARSVAGYGAPGKSATLLHYCGIGKDLIEYTVDRSPYKQGPIPARQPHSDFSSRPDPRDQAGLCRDSALEPEGRNYGAIAVHPRLGRPLCRANSKSHDLLSRRIADESSSFLWRRRNAAQGLRR